MTEEQSAAERSAAERRRVTGRRREDAALDQATFAEAFVALRAIGWKVEEIGALGPDDVLEELIHHWIGAFEVAGERRV